MSSLCPTQATQTTQTTAGLSPWSQPYVSSMLGAAQQQVFNTDPSTGQVTGIVPYQAYGSPVAGSQYLAGMGPGESAAAQSAVAAPTALQNLAYGSAAGMQTPGQFGAATDIGQTAGYGLLNTAGQAQGLQNLGMQAVQAGQQFGQQMTNPNAVQAYMNPYIQKALQPQIDLLQTQQAEQANKMAGQAVGAGAFGGSRYGIEQANQNLNNQLAMQNLIGQGYNTAYNNAVNAMQNAAAQGLQGYQTGISGYGQGISGQTGAYGQAGQLAQGLGSLGTQQLGAQQNIIGLQNQLGQQQQALNQAVINQAMQNFQQQKMYPQTQLSYLSSLLSGLPVSSQGAVSSIPGPNLLSQLSGLGLAGAAVAKSGLLGASGGLPKDFKKTRMRAPDNRQKQPGGLMDLALDKIGG